MKKKIKFKWEEGLPEDFIEACNDLNAFTSRPAPENDGTENMSITELIDAIDEDNGYTEKKGHIIIDLSEEVGKVIENF